MAARNTTKKTTATKTANAKATPAKAPTKKAPAAVDAMGCRVGTQSAAINAKITTKPKDVATLAAEAKVTVSRCRNHLRHLLSKGLIEQTDAGYAKPTAKRTRKAAK